MAAKGFQFNYVQELYTVVENMSGVARYYGFLGLRGMKLDPFEVVAVRGDLITKLGAMTSARRFDALKGSLHRHSLSIRSRPSPILWDQATSSPKQVIITGGGTLGIADPSWATPESSLIEINDD